MTGFLKMQMAFLKMRTSLFLAYEEECNCRVSSKIRTAHTEKTKFGFTADSRLKLL